MRLYPDACCLCRFFDDQTQPRVRMETEAIRIIVDRCYRGAYVWVAGEVVKDELSRDQDVGRRVASTRLLDHAAEQPRLTAQAIALARRFVAEGVREIDALHLAAANEARCDAFLTTDDRLRSAGRRIIPLPVRQIENPASWLLQLPKP